MTITENEMVVHELVPAIDHMGKACVQDEITGMLYYPEAEIPYIPLDEEEENPAIPEETRQQKRKKQQRKEKQSFQIKEWENSGGGVVIWWKQKY